MKKLVVIDLDSITYVIAYNHREEEDEDAVYNSAKTFIDVIIEKTEAEFYAGFYQKPGHQNYRTPLVPSYKANRPTTPDYITKWRDTIHRAFSSFPGVVPLTVIESDDALSIYYNQYKDTYDLIFAHIDKDLNCIPGNHYNYSKGEFYSVSTKKAYMFFKEQLLCGDSTDNIKGVPGIGPAKAAGYITQYESPIVAFKMAAKAKKVRKWITLFYETYTCINLLNSLEELKKYTQDEEVDIFKIAPTVYGSTALDMLEDDDWD